jgi:hypothetical protein
MGNKTTLLLFIALLLFPAFTLSAQENSAPSLAQRISWYADENIIRYEVVVERALEQESYREVLRETTGDDFLEFSLPAGDYRYRIRAWDIFEKPTPYSPWYPLEIRLALQPELFEVAVESGEAPRLIVKGKNLSPDAELRLLRRGGAQIGTGNFQAETAGDDEEGTAALQAPLRPGKYELTLQNPGGFSASISFTVQAPARPGSAFQISAAYTPLLPLYGEFNDLLDTPFYPAGALLRFEFLPLRFSAFSLGLGLSPSWHMISTTYEMNNRKYEVSGHFLGAQGFILGQLQLPVPGLAINLRAGGGIFLLQDLNKHNADESYETISVMLPAGSGGLSVLWTFKKPFFAEAGLEITHFFSVDNPSPGYLRPFVGLGLSF